MEYIIQSLNMTINPQNQDEIKIAENTLIQLRQNPQFVLDLMQIVSQNQLSLDLRMAALIQMKNYIEKSWNQIDSEIQMKIKNIIVDAVIQISHEQNILKVYQKVIQIIGDQDQFNFDLIQQAFNNIQNAQNTNTIYGSLCIIKNLIKKYEFILNNERQPFTQIISNLHAMLLKVLQQFWNSQERQIVKMILKIYFVSINGVICDQGMINLSQWIMILWNFQDNQKLVYRIYLTILNKYKKKNSKNGKKLQEILSQYSQNIIEQCFTLVGQNLDMKISNCLLKIILISRNIPECKQIYQKFNLFQILLRFFKVDEKEFQNVDQQEYLKQEDNNLYIAQWNKSLAVKILQKFIYKEQDEQQIKLFLNQLIDKVENDQGLDRDAYIQVLLESHEYLLEKNEIPRILVSIQNDLQSNNLIVKAKAIQVYKYYYDNSQTNAQILLPIAQYLQSQLNNSNLLIQVYSLETISYLCNIPQIKNIFSQFLDQILSQYIKLIQTIDRQQLVSAFICKNYKLIQNYKFIQNLQNLYIQSQHQFIKSSTQIYQIFQFYLKIVKKLSTYNLNLNLYFKLNKFLFNLFKIEFVSLMNQNLSQYSVILVDNLSNICVSNIRGQMEEEEEEEEECLMEEQFSEGCVQLINKILDCDLNQDQYQAIYDRIVKIIYLTIEYELEELYDCVFALQKKLIQKPQTLIQTTFVFFYLYSYMLLGVKQGINLDELGEFKNLPLRIGSEAHPKLISILQTIISRASTQQLQQNFISQHSPLYLIIQILQNAHYSIAFSPLHTFLEYHNLTQIIPDILNFALQLNKSQKNIQQTLALIWFCLFKECDLVLKVVQIEQILQQSFEQVRKFSEKEFKRVIVGCCKLMEKGLYKNEIMNLISNRQQNVQNANESDDDDDFEEGEAIEQEINFDSQLDQLDWQQYVKNILANSKYYILRQSLI